MAVRRGSRARPGLGSRSGKAALAGKLNDELAAAISLHPGRLAGFAALPTASPAEAADELEHAVRWGWHAEAGLHALRLVMAGVFDRHPGLKLVIGHCGR